MATYGAIGAIYVLLVRRPGKFGVAFTQLAISQGNLRRGSSAVYMPVSHPEIEEFIDIRRQRVVILIPNIHHGIVISDAFWKMRHQSKNNEVIETIQARSLWIKILTARVETGEPYILFYDRVNELRPEAKNWVRGIIYAVKSLYQQALII